MHGILAGLLAIGILTGTSHTVSPSELELGKTVFMKRCKVCHGVRGDGKSFAANVLYPPPRNFTSPEWRKKLTLERMIESATNGRPGTAMMPWKDVLSEKEIRAVVLYIRKELMGVKD